MTDQNGTTNFEDFDLEDFNFEECYEYVKKSILEKGNGNYWVDDYCSSMGIYLTSDDYHNVVNFIYNILEKEDNA